MLSDTTKKFITAVSLFALLFFAGSVYAIAEANQGEGEGDANLAWVESDGEHVREKNLFETERVYFNLPVSPYPDVKFQVWNCTTQTLEREVTSEGGKITVGLLKDHNYIFFCMSKEYQVASTKNLYVWVKDGKLVSTKSVSIDDTGYKTWSYPEVTSINLVRREEAVASDDDARRKKFTWDFLFTEDPKSRAIGWSNMKVHFVSTVETVDADVYTDDDKLYWTRVSASLLEDVDYMIYFDRGGNTDWSMSVAPLPVVYKDKCEYTGDYAYSVLTFDHRSCYAVENFTWATNDEITKEFDTLTSEDKNTTVSGMDFTTSGATGREPKLLCKDVTSQHKNLLSHEYSVYSIKAENTSRSEALKVKGLTTGTGDTIDVAFKYTQKVESGKTVGAIYELASNGALSKLDSFSQTGDTVTFTTNSLSENDFVVEYTDEVKLQTVLNLKVTDQDGENVAGEVFSLEPEYSSTAQVFTLPATDNYGETSLDFKDLDVDSTQSPYYKLKLASSSKNTLETSVSVTFDWTEDGKIYIKRVNYDEYDGSTVAVKLRVPVNRTLLKLKVVDAYDRPVESVCLKLTPQTDNTQHKTTIIIPTKSSSDGMIYKDITDLIPTGTTSEHYYIDATAESDSGKDGKYESSAQLKSRYYLKINGQGCATPGIEGVGEVSPFGVLPGWYEWTGQKTVTAITYALVTFKGSGKVSDQLVNAKVGDRLTEPTKPTCDNYIFEGWYKDDKFTTKWDFYEDKVKDDTTLYSKWTKDSASDDDPSASRLRMYRLYNKWTGEHFYTSDATERDKNVKLGWTDEGTGWFAPKSSKTPVYRLFNKYVEGGDHHYTTSTSERDDLKKAGWTYEGIGWYSDDAKGMVLYRQYNPYAKTGTHNYTTSKKENDNLVKEGWTAEGTAWYGVYF